MKRRAAFAGFLVAFTLLISTGAASADNCTGAVDTENCMAAINAVAAIAAAAAAGGVIAISLTNLTSPEAPEEEKEAVKRQHCEQNLAQLQTMADEISRRVQSADVGEVGLLAVAVAEAGGRNLAAEIRETKGLIASYWALRERWMHDCASVVGALPPDPAVWDSFYPERTPEELRSELCETLSESLRQKIGEFVTADRRIGEISDAIAAVEKLRGSLAAVAAARKVVSQAIADYEYCTGKQKVYWYLFGWWAEGAYNLSQRFWFWATTALGFTGAIGYVEGEYVAAALVRLGASGAKVKAAAGVASGVGFAVTATIGAANYFGPAARAALAEMYTEIGKAQSALSRFEAQVIPVFDRARELAAVHGGEALTVADQQGRLQEIEGLKARLEQECPETPVPEMPGTLTVRGLERDWALRLPQMPERGW